MHKMFTICPWVLADERKHALLQGMNENWSRNKPITEMMLKEEKT